MAISLLACASATSTSVGQSWWRFEESKGPVVSDAGPNGLDGQLDSTPTRIDEVPLDPVPQTGSVNTRGLDLDGSGIFGGGAFEVGDPAGLLSFGDTSDFTVEAWVRLDQLSDTSGPSQRQHLLQKKAIAGDSTADYTIRVQRGDSSPGVSYGKTSGFSGRELQIVFGTGSGVWNVTSHLELDDLQWHHVSIACDLEAGTIRFGLDGAFETIAFGDDPRVRNVGALLVGAHRNAQGVRNQFLRGSIDELRIEPRFVPVEQLLDAPGVDCNSNGELDALEILSGASGDCNANGIPDDCEIADGSSEDCQSDGIPDECQLVESIYALDDGEADISVRSDGTHMAWLNSFTVTPGGESLVAIDATFGDSAAGQSVTLCIWSDPDGDGDPTDATVLASRTLVVEVGMTDPDTLVRLDMPQTKIGPIGTSFFVGVVVDVELGGSDFPARADWDEPTTPDRSWIVGAIAPIDANDLSANAVEFDLFENVLPAGNWSVRAVVGGGTADCNANGVPDECDIADGVSADLDGNGVPDECEIPGVYTVPGDFSTIDAAVATVAPGSTVLVSAGTWFEQVDFRGKSIEVRSASGPGQTVIDGGGTGSVVLFQSGEGPDAVLEGFTITNGGGTPGLGGGGVFCQDASPTIRGNVISGNSCAEVGGGILVLGDASPTIVENRIAENFAEDGGGVYANLSNNTLAIHDNEIEQNHATSGSGGGVTCINGSIDLARNRIAENSCGGSGGGIFVIFSGNATPRIESNLVLSNSAADDGGGLWLSNGGGMLVVNTVFADNVAPVGGGVYVRDNATIANCTIADNLATIEGGGLHYDDGASGLAVENSILHGNASPTSPDLRYPNGSAAVIYSNVAGGWPGVGNIDAAPIFVAPEADDYALAAGSPGIDAGDSLLFSIEDVATDLAGNPRVVDDPRTADTGVPDSDGAVIDMGALERQPPDTCPADLDGDLEVGASDLTMLLGDWGAIGGSTADLDGDGVVGPSDLAALLAAWGACP